MVREADFPILEYDPAKKSIIEPSELIDREDFPERGVITFYRELKQEIGTDPDVKEIDRIEGETMDIPILELQHDGKRVALVDSPPGSPAAGGILEELIARGCNKIIACGNGGVLKEELKRGSVMIVESALRDEGTSYHYQPPSREIKANQEIVKTIEKVLNNHKVNYIKGKTWTTDAFYRETKDMREKRKNRDCLTVEMEASALIAISQYRKIKFGQIIGFGDDITGENWNLRKQNKTKDNKQKILQTAIQTTTKI